MKNRFCGLVAGLAGAVMLIGCGSTAPPDERNNDSFDPVQVRVGGGAESRQLGIVMWEMMKDGRIVGIGPNGNTIRSFRSLPGSKRIESLNAGGGTRVYADDGSIEDSFPPEIQGVYAAFLKDATARKTPSSTSCDGEIGSTSQPVWVGPIACCFGNLGFYADYWYWIDDATGRATPYCHLDTHQNIPCSAETSCIDYGYSTGCLYWI
jgi:hypothetical protein